MKKALLPALVVGVVCDVYTGVGDARKTRSLMRTERGKRSPYEKKFQHKFKNFSKQLSSDFAMSTMI